MKNRITRLILALLITATLASLLSACALSKIQRGETTDSTYTNAALGVTFEIPDGWTFYTDEEIAAIMNISADLWKDEDLINNANVSSIIDFMAVQTASGNSVNLSIENLKASGNAGISVKEYIEASKKLIREQLTGATYTFDDDTDVTLGDKTYTRLSATCSYSGVTMKQYLYIRKVGSHMVVITATSTNGTNANVFEKMFS